MNDDLPIPAYFTPSAWPPAVRRAFRLTLPISGPLYVATCLPCFAVVGLLVALGAIGLFIQHCWARP